MNRYEIIFVVGSVMCWSAMLWWKLLRLLFWAIGGAG